MLDSDSVFDAGLTERIRKGRMSLSDCTLLYEALRPFGCDAYSDEVDASWPVTVVNEFKKAVDAARGNSGWHVFGPGHKSLTHSAASASDPERVFFSGLEVMRGEFTHCSLVQTSPLPGADNTLTLSFSSNVAIGPSHLDATTSLPTKLILSGLTSLFSRPNLEQNTRVALGGSVAQHLSSSHSAAAQDLGFASWDAETGSLVAFVSDTLAPDATHMLSFSALNPPDGRSDPADGELCLEARGAVDIAPAHVHTHAKSAGTEAAGRSGAGAGAGGGLAVIPPRFLVARIKQGSLFPGAENRIAVSVALSCGLRGAQGQRLVLSGLLGSQTPDTDKLPIQYEDADAEGGSAVFGTEAVWRRVGGVLELRVVGDLEGGREVRLSFVLCNPPAPLPPEERGEGVFIAAAGAAVEGRRMDPEVPSAERKEEVRGGAEVVQETEAEVEERGEDWYATFSGHLRRQYPDLYGGREGGVRAEVPGVVMVGVTGEFEVSAEREGGGGRGGQGEGGGGLRVRWRRTGPARLSAHSPIYILQVSTSSSSSSSSSSFRTVYAGLDSACLLPPPLAPPSQPLLLRVREEAFTSPSSLLSSTWSPPCKVPPLSSSSSSSATPFSFSRSHLLWDPSSLGAGVRLSSHHRSMRRDNLTGWGRALGVAGVGRGATAAFRFAFMGRAERVMVGVALKEQASDAKPAVWRWAEQHGGQSRVECPRNAEGERDSLCVVWCSDGNFITFGRGQEARRGAERAMCIEGDTIGVKVDNVRGWVEFYKGRELLEKMEFSVGDGGEMDGGNGMLFPFACSGGGCTVSLLPFDE